MTDNADTPGGTYTLLVERRTQATIDVGALGEFVFDPGWYAYVGSATGSGGFSRVDRHRELTAGARDVRHWHIDYLLGDPGTEIDTVVRTAGVDGECAVARGIDGTAIPDFGCSDCDCGSHLFYSERRAPLLAAVEAGHSDIRTA